MRLELMLDARQKALLREMGIKVWQAALPAGLITLSEDQLTPNEGLSTASERVSSGLHQKPTQGLSQAVKAVTVPVSSLPAEVQTTTDRQATACSVSKQHLSSLSWLQLIQQAQQCDACRLGQYRQKMVWGRFLNDTHQEQAPLKTSVLVVLDPPSEYEEDAAQPAVMQVGRLLRAMLRETGLDNEQHPVFMSNVSKCRIPSGFRNPQSDISTCLAYLEQQIERLQPKIILVLGWGAAQVMSAKMEPRPSTHSLGHLRGVVQHYLGIPTIVSFAPAYLIRNPQDKAKTWDDLCLLMQCLEDVYTQ